MLVLGLKKLEHSPPKIKIDVNANRGSPTWKPLLMVIETNGVGLESILTTLKNVRMNARNGKRPCRYILYTWYISGNFK
jgi:hypothetical protein